MEKFSSYMSQWLYAENGYYSRFKDIGKAGDFYTAVSSSMFFGGSIAKKFLKTIEDDFLSENCYVVEIGAHKGYLLADMVQFIYTLKPELIKSLKFVIVEPFEQNRVEQKKYFEKSFGNAIELLHVRSLKELTCKDAFFVANEIFDAFPCEVIYKDEMLYMENNEPRFGIMDEDIYNISKKYGISKGEIAIGYEEFANDMSNCCEKYEFVTFDYGDKFGREDFSLRIYVNHKVYPFFSLTNFIKDEKLKSDIKLSDVFKSADITYDVNFAHLIGAYEESGAKLYNFSAQMKALIDFGLIELLEMMKNNAKEESYESELNRVKTLIDPAFMGERFKMATFRKE